DSLHSKHTCQTGTYTTCPSTLLLISSLTAAPSRSTRLVHFLLAKAASSASNMSPSVPTDSDVEYSDMIDLSVHAERRYGSSEGSAMSTTGMVPTMGVVGAESGSESESVEESGLGLPTRPVIVTSASPGIGSGTGLGLARETMRCRRSSRDRRGSPRHAGAEARRLAGAVKAWTWDWLITGRERLR
ncbi:hypothetical protein FB45DRAFT_940160, partial [Roridomyces roridus]